MGRVAEVLVPAGSGAEAQTEPERGAGQSPSGERGAGQSSATAALAAAYGDVSE